MHTEYKAFFADYFRFFAFSFLMQLKIQQIYDQCERSEFLNKIRLVGKRLFKVGIFQVVAALYKAFGQTFIYDDHFLSIVGAICSFFNCSGRLIYGFIMDKTSYKMAMSIEAVLLTVLGKYIHMNSAFISN